jgi:hypothetical protein
MRYRVSGQPITVVADPCRWRVAGLSTDTSNVRGKPFDAVVP